MGCAARNGCFLSRDRFGKKPLFWFNSRGTFAFASELTALLAHPALPASSLAKGLQKFFAYALVPAPRSLIEGVWKLPAGHNLILDAGAEPVVSRYWRFEIEPDEGMMRRSRVELAEELLETLDRAVKRRLMADVPSGRLFERRNRFDGGCGSGGEAHRRRAPAHLQHWIQ